MTNSNNTNGMMFTYPIANEIRTTNAQALESDRWAVGQIYPAYKNIAEGVSHDIYSDGITVRVMFRHPSAFEISEFRNGKPQFALVEDSGVQFFMSKFGALPWSSSAKNYSLSMTEKLEPKSNIMTCLMIDTSTGKLVAIRVLGLHMEFVNRAVAGVNRQLETSYSFDEFSQKIKDLWLKYPTENKLLKRANCKYDFASGRIR